MPHGEALKRAGIVLVAVLLLQRPIAFVANGIIDNVSILTMLFVPGALLIRFLNTFVLLPIVAAIGAYLLIRDGKSAWYLLAAAAIWPALLWSAIVGAKGKSEKGIVVEEKADKKRTSGFPSESIINKLVRDPSGETTAGYFVDSLFKRTFARSYKDNVDTATAVINSENRFFDEHDRHHTAGKKFLARQLERQQLTPQHIQDQLSFDQQRQELERLAQVKRLRDELGTTPQAEEEVEVLEKNSTPAQKFEERVLAQVEIEKTKKRLLEQHPDLADGINSESEQAQHDLSIDDLLEDDS